MSNDNVSARLVNEEIVLALHHRKLRKKRTHRLARPESYLSRMLQAVRRFPFLLETATNEEIQTHLENLGLSDSTYFEVARAINEVLKYLGRPKGIDNPRPALPLEVTKIDLNTFLKRIDLIKRDEFKYYIGGLFATGCRVGELPRVVVEGDWARVYDQVRLTGRVSLTKNKKARDAAILPPLKSFIMAYKALPEERQVWLRVKGYQRLYKACKRNLGINLHTLRHSYAVECALRGKTAAEIASYIGDSERVTKEYYMRYIKTKVSPW